VDRARATVVMMLIPGVMSIHVLSAGSIAINVGE
jgi:hypothetical protein